MPPGEDVNDPRDNVAPSVAWPVYPGAFPGYIGSETYHREADRHVGSWWSQPDIRGIESDPSLGAIPGDVDTLPYSMNVVNPNNVEDFSLMGNMARLRRPAESNKGPVGSLDYRSQLAMQIVQQMTPDVYDEASQLSVIGGF